MQDNNVAKMLMVVSSAWPNNLRCLVMQLCGNVWVALAMRFSHGWRAQFRRSTSWLILVLKRRLGCTCNATHQRNAVF